MLKFLLAFFLLLATLAIVYADNACFYSHGDHGRCYYRCRDACKRDHGYHKQRSMNWMRDRNHQCHSNDEYSFYCDQDNHYGNCHDYKWDC